ncbi:unnamed protein product [Caenorhabditis sp. 36 PRJEB53466]|nr:unnamed protein product [Caenorhabditis sp. 36 PRJEB53466]
MKLIFVLLTLLPFFWTLYAAPLPSDWKGIDFKLHDERDDMAVDKIFESLNTTAASELASTAPSVHHRRLKKWNFLE